MYALVTGPKHCSGMGLAAWLWMRTHKVPVEHVELQDTSAAAIERYSPTGSLPALLRNGSSLAWNVLPILESIAEQFPDAAALWPPAAQAR